jgi:urocanate hydratase
MRLKTRYLDRRADTLDDALAIIADATAKRQPVSVGLLGNAAEVLPELVRRGVRPDMVTDQTSAHDLVYGYLPAGWSVERWFAAQRDSHAHAGLAAAARQSIRTHVEAMLAFHRAGIPTSARSRSTRALPRRSRFPGSCPRTSGRCSARARDRFAGPRSRATPTTFTRPTAR